MHLICTNNCLLSIQVKQFLMRRVLIMYLFNKVRLWCARVSWLGCFQIRRRMYVLIVYVCWLNPSLSATWSLQSGPVCRQPSSHLGSRRWEWWRVIDSRWLYIWVTPVLCCPSLGLSYLVQASFSEDQYGVVQTTLPRILSCMLVLQEVLFCWCL